MAPFRDRGPASLLARVRWGNLARLAAIVAAGVLIAAGPRGCAAGGEELPRLPVDPARPPAAPPDLAQPEAPPENDRSTDRRPVRKRSKDRRRARKRRARAPRRSSERRRPAN